MGFDSFAESNRPAVSPSEKAGGAAFALNRTLRESDQNKLRSDSKAAGKSDGFSLPPLELSDLSKAGDSHDKNPALDRLDLSRRESSGTVETASERTGLKSDSFNRVVEVERSDGKRLRKYEYFDGDDNEIKTLTILDRTNGTSSVLTRESKDSKLWRSDSGQIWTGEIQVSSDGVHSVRSTADGTRWSSYHQDGRETFDVINAEGSRLMHDRDNNLVGYRGADGTEMDRITLCGREMICCRNLQTGENSTWTKGDNGLWTCDSPFQKFARRELAFNGAGEFSYTNESGDKVQERRDGGKQVTAKDGSCIEFDTNGEITKLRKDNLERIFLRDGNGILSVRDHSLKGQEKRIVFERRPQGEETRKYVTALPTGDLKYENSDGSVVIERTNLQRIELDSAGDLKRVSSPRNARTFDYAGTGMKKVLVAVTDSRETNGSRKTESWQRVSNPDGSLSNEFRSRDEKGKIRKPRFNISPRADGEYEYRLASDGPGEKAHLEKLTREGSTYAPEGVEDARQELISRLAERMESSRLRLNEGLMRGFEKRMLDQAELQMAAGIDPAKVIQETQRCITDTYYHCARLTEARGPREIYSLKDRLRLSENLLYLACNPSEIKQGGQGTCWWESSWNAGLFQRNAGDAARFCADIALNGQYTSTAGPLSGGARKTIRVPLQYVSLDRRDAGAGWTPLNSRQSSQRSMVGMLIDQVGPPLGGQRGWGQSDAGWHDEARNILYMMTGRDNLRHGSSSLGSHEKIQLLKTGGWTASGGGHMWAYSMQKDKDGQWLVIRDDQYAGGDRVIQKVGNLRQWISSDLQATVRKQWRGHPGLKQDNYSPSLLADGGRNSFYITQTRPRSGEISDLLPLRTANIPRPVWRPERQS